MNPTKKQTNVQTIQTPTTQIT